jgi:hypothetical protein
MDIPKAALTVNVADICTENASSQRFCSAEENALRRINWSKRAGEQESDEQAGCA